MELQSQNQHLMLLIMMKNYNSHTVTAFFYGRSSVRLINIAQSDHIDTPALRISF